MRVLITAGPTVEPIDPVRFISNHSSGKQGYYIAEAFLKAGYEVILISGPTDLSCSNEIKLIKVTTAEEMLNACVSNLPVDVAIFTAAVCDYRVKNPAAKKIKKEKTGEELSLELIANPDILKTISNITNRPKLVIGFAAETNDVLENAKNKLVRKNCDAIIACNLSGAQVFGSENTDCYYINKDSFEDWSNLNKQEVAKEIVAKINTFNNCR
jgi:phosphopantothenoylcysteine decarboxylase/phosphopantothenate--cysteine ligase